jgi:hypothetical protein
VPIRGRAPGDMPWLADHLGGGSPLGNPSHRPSGTGIHNHSLVRAVRLYRRVRWSGWVNRPYWRTDLAMRSSLGLVGCLAALGLAASNASGTTASRHTGQPAAPTGPQTNQVVQPPTTAPFCPAGSINLTPQGAECLPGTDGAWSGSSWNDRVLPACPLERWSPPASPTPATTAAPDCDPSIIGYWNGQPLSDGVIRWS